MGHGKVSNFWKPLDGRLQTLKILQGLSPFSLIEFSVTIRTDLTTIDNKIGYLEKRKNIKRSIKFQGSHTLETTM